MAIAVIITAALVWLARSGALASLLSANYLPHRYCYLAQPGLVWTNVVMDGLIAASYAVIFSSLFWIASRLRSLEAIRGYLWIFFAFGTFIAACGATHLMEVVTVWWPVYPLSATVKVICAAASVPTALVFARISPTLAANIRRFLDMLSTSQQEREQAILSLIASEKLAVAGRISASIAHEIKGPLDSLGNVLYLLAQDKRTSPDMVRMIDGAGAELARAIATAHDTLALFQSSDEPVAVSLTDVVQSVLELQNGDLLKRNIRLQSRLQTPVALRAYSGELRQILSNLIQNASAAIGQDGSILVRVQPRHSMGDPAPKLRLARNAPQIESDGLGRPGYSITISDSGPGINPLHRSRLFTLFFTTKGEQGTGLGLWLVRSMVEKQGGRIRFRSRTAAESSRPGTIFNVWLPLAPTPIAAARSSTDLAWPRIENHHASRV